MHDRFASYRQRLPRMGAGLLLLLVPLWAGADSNLSRRLPTVADTALPPVPVPFYAYPPINIPHDYKLPVWQNVAIIEQEYQRRLSRPVAGMLSLQDFQDIDPDLAVVPVPSSATQQPQIAFVQPDREESTLLDDSALEAVESVPVDTDDTPADLWTRIRQGFRLSGQDNPRVQQHIDWYARHQDYLDRVVARAQPFLYDIVQEVARNDMPMEVALLPVVESAFQPFAYSPGRAAGIWQFIPATGRRYGLKQNWWYDGRRDVQASTRAALHYLKDLSKRFDGDWHLALAAYNSGEGRVQRAIRKNTARGKKVDFWSLDLPAETREYVPKLLAISAIVEDSAAYDIDLLSVPDEPYLTQVDIGSQIDLALAADLAGLPIDILYQLNPAYNRWATDPDGPHVLSLPLDIAGDFETALANTDARQRVKWHRHTIKQGETLGGLAHKYQTTVKLLQQVNNIHDKWIRAGQGIIIPVATKDLKQYLSEDQRRLAIQHTPRNGRKIVHTVQRGDTLWDLSLEYDVSVEQLASWNSMAPRDAIKPGQKLVIWADKPSVVASRFNAPPSSHTQQRLQYRVRKGDSLARIASKFRVTVGKLRHWNSLPKGKYLQPGQLLTLYVDVTRQS